MPHPWNDPFALWCLSFLAIQSLIPAEVNELSIHQRKRQKALSFDAPFTFEFPSVPCFPRVLQTSVAWDMNYTNHQPSSLRNISRGPRSGCTRQRPNALTPVVFFFLFVLNPLTQPTFLAVAESMITRFLNRVGEGDLSRHRGGKTERERERHA